MADEKSVDQNVTETVTTAPTETALSKTDDVVDAVKATKKTAKKATKKVAKKTTKKIAKKATTKKTASKKAASKKTATKKATAKKTTTKKASKKVTKKIVEPMQDTSDDASKVEARIKQIQMLLQNNLSGLSGDKAEAMAKNIWLAGLGAYSKTYEEISDRYDDVQDKYEEINAEGQKLFGDLVGRGQLVQDQLETKVGKGRKSLEDRVDEIKSRFGGGLSSYIDLPERLSRAAEKIEAVSVKLRKKK